MLRLSDLNGINRLYNSESDSLMTLELICKKAYESILINNVDPIYLNKIVRWNSSDWRTRKKKSKMVKIKFVLLLTTLTLQAQGKWNSLVISRPPRTDFRPSVHPSTSVYIFIFLMVRRLNSSMSWMVCISPAVHLRPSMENIHRIYPWNMDGMIPNCPHGRKDGPQTAV